MAELRGPAAFALLLLAATAAFAGSEPDLGRDLDTHLRILRSDEVGTAGIGDHGLSVAARYLAVQARHLGYQGAGPAGSFLLPFTVELEKPAGACLLSLRRGESSHVLKPGADFAPHPESGEGEVESGVRFVSRSVGMTDVEGRIVLLPSAPGLRERVAVAQRLGAVGAMVFPDPRTVKEDLVVFADGATARGRVTDLGTRFRFAPAGGGAERLLGLEEVSEIRLGVSPGPMAGLEPRPPAGRRFGVPVVSISLAAASRILGRPAGAVLKAAEDGELLPEFRVEATEIRIRVGFEREKRTISAVAFRTDGNPRARGGAAAVLCARYDGHRVDRAATALLGAASLLRQRPVERGGVLFVLWPGGADGTLGPKGLIPGLAKTYRPRAWVLLEQSADPGVAADGAEGELQAALQKASRTIAGRAPAGADALPPALEGAVGPRAVLRGRLDGTEAQLAIARSAANVARAVPAPKPAPTPPPKPPEKAPAVRGPAVEPTLEAAREARVAGTLEAAHRAIEGALDASPGAITLYLERGRIRIASGDLGGAMEDAANLEKLEPGSGWSELLRSEAWSASGREENARAALDRATSSELPEAFLARAAGRLRTGLTGALEARRTREDLRKAAELAPDRAPGLCARGLLALLADRGELAVDQLSQAIEKDPYLAIAYLYRAEARVRLDRDPALAAKDCDRATALGLKDVSILFNRGLCRLKLRMYTLAIRDFTIYIEREPNSPSAVYNIACAHALMGNTEEALRWLAHSVERGFRDPAHARADPDLESIRTDDRFERALRATHSD